MNNNTVNNFAEIQWSTYSESDLLGYNIYRGENNNFATSQRINFDLINATNTSQLHTYSYVDTYVEENTTYYYWLQSTELSNINEVHGPVVLTIEAISGDVEVIETENIAGIKAIYPNPFNPETTIRYYLAQDSNVEFEVYNLIGQKVSSLDLGNKTGERYHTVTWNGKDSRNNECPSGVYFFRISSKDFTQTTKAVLSK